MYLNRENHCLRPSDFLCCYTSSLRHTFLGRVAKKKISYLLHTEEIQ